MRMAENQRTRTCSVDGCTKPHRSRGLCDAHYSHARRNGLIEVAEYKRWASPEDRFWAKVDKSGTCWEWTASTFKGGYGCFRWDARRSESAHRVAFKFAEGDIPDGLQVDHICFNRKCVRPSHLRLATNKQNNEHRRGAHANNRTSGIRGVTRSSDGKKWTAQVGHNGVRMRLGYFDTVEEAAAAALAKRLELFTHNNADRLS